MTSYTRVKAVEFAYRDESWMSKRACDNETADMFHPEGYGSDRTMAEAVKICAGCPVRLNCLDYAIRTDDQWGVFGGLTPDERRALNKQAS